MVPSWISKASKWLWVKIKLLRFCHTSNCRYLGRSRATPQLMVFIDNVSKQTFTCVSLEEGYWSLQRVRSKHGKP